MSRRSPALARIAGALLCLVGLAVLLGWLIDAEVLRALVPGGVAMNPLTAICFLLLGAALLREAGGGPVVRGRGTTALAGSTTALAGSTTALAGVTAFFAATCVFAYLGGPDAGLDRLLFARELAAYDPPNRVAPNTAFALLLGAFGLLLVRARSERTVVVGQLAALAAAVAGLVALVGYVFGLADLAGLRAYVRMSLPTSLGLALLGAGVLALRTEAGLVRAALSQTAGGQIFRRVAPVAVLLPPLLAWLGVHAVDAGLMSQGVAVSLAVIVDTVVLVVLIGMSARAHERVELARVEADARTEALLRDLRRKSAELAAANGELESFSYSVSHDLRAPLRSITSFSQVLLEDFGATLEPEARAHLDRIIRAGARMSLLIDDLIELARASRGELARTAVDVSAMAHEVIEDLKAAEPARTVETTVQPGLEAWADPRLLRVVLVNLIGNAWKYSGRAEHARIEVGALARASDDTLRAGPVVFFVRDNGIGFDMEYAERLFTPFQRLHRNDDFAGSGIGLATVRRIVNRHGGSVRAESAPGAGATFYFTLNPDSDG